MSKLYLKLFSQNNNFELSVGPAIFFTKSHSMEKKGFEAYFVENYLKKTFGSIKKYTVVLFLLIFFYVSEGKMREINITKDITIHNYVYHY